MMFLKLRKKACHIIKVAAIKIDIKINWKFITIVLQTELNYKVKTKWAFDWMSQPSYLQYGNVLGMARDIAE